jgi:16S rRNA (uracil1498-N3)-methyltransferase
LEQEVIDIPSPKLHLAIALTKNASRLEWFLEKATEIGVQSITPLITSRTEKKSFKHERGEKIVIAAMKQSLRFHLPILSQAISIEELLESERNLSHNKFVGHYKPENKQLKDSVEKGNSTTILIGPEGDFTENEIVAVTQAGFTSINLGNHRLRTETAGIVACHTFNIINNG